MLDAALPTRILVVEDEFLIRMTLVEALTDEGYDVLEAENGDAAMSLLQADPSIAMLLTDIQLPGSLDGEALANAARAARPELPVLFMTGRPDPRQANQATARNRYIAKPYTLADITRTVSELTRPG